MTTVAIRRGTPARHYIQLEVYERRGNLMVAKDVGKPKARTYRVGTVDPKVSDQRAGLEAFTVTGQLVGDNAYDNARRLAEDIVKAPAGNDNTVLNLSAIDGLSWYDVVFPGSGALRLHYPGHPNWVSVQFTAHKAEYVNGGGTVPDTSSSATTGSKNVTISRGATSLELKYNLQVERKVGRPSLQMRYGSGEAYAVDMMRAATDIFSISGTFVTDTGTTQATLMDDILKPKLGYGNLTLDFDGLYTLGEYDVVPNGSQAARVTWSAGERDMVHLDKLELMVVDQPT